MEKKLTRSEKERILGGVCGGLAEYFGLDPTLVRLVFVLLALAGGAGILLYIILWIIMPRRPQAEAREVVGENIEDIKKRLVELEAEVKTAVTSEKAEEWKQSAGFWLGLVLAALGFIFLLANLGIFRWWRWAVLWPVALILLGLLLLWRRR
jgi:phage shock protein C